MARARNGARSGAIAERAERRNNAPDLLGSAALVIVPYSILSRLFEDEDSTILFAARLQRRCASVSVSLDASFSTMCSAVSGRAVPPSRFLSSRMRLEIEPVLVRTAAQPPLRPGRQHDGISRSEASCNRGTSSPACPHGFSPSAKLPNRTRWSFHILIGNHLAGNPCRDSHLALDPISGRGNFVEAEICGRSPRRSCQDDRPKSAPLVLEHVPLLRFVVGHCAFSVADSGVLAAAAAGTVIA